MVMTMPQNLSSKKSDNVLWAKGVYKAYGQLEILKDISLTVKRGEFLAITGHSGAGKSTLLHILGGLDKPDKGQIQIMEKNFFDLSGKKQMLFLNTHIGFVFQFHHLLPEFTALENVCMPLWIRGEKKVEAEKKALVVLERVGLKQRIDHKPAALSGGERQRVAIARALINKPAIVFADEPTGNLDSENAASIHQLLLELQKEYKLTCIVVTHNEEMASVAERRLKMKDGVFVN